jgi:KaiC/GvpD/RAD55 family RecA-like ATPase
MIKLILTKAEDVQKKFIESIKKKKGSGVVILTTKSFAGIDKTLKDKGNILFVDTVGSGEQNNVINTAPSNLSALSITISEGLQAMKSDKKFLVFDSIMPLLIHNDAKSVSKFFLFIIEKLREWDVDTDIIATSEKIDEEVVSLIIQGVDKVENSNKK